MLRHEAEVMQQFDHPNIIKFKHVREFENYIFLAVELASGGSLADLIRRREKQGKRITEEESCNLCTALLHGLSEIHRHDYIHRDLKPGNVVIEDPNDLSTVKVIDFGLALKVVVAANQPPDDNCGTLVYQAPEQALSQSYGKVRRVPSPPRLQTFGRSASSRTRYSPASTRSG